MPIGLEEWEKVVDDHSVMYPVKNIESIRRKYDSLNRKKVPTGDPSISIEVRMAKRFKYFIEDIVELCGGEEQYSIESNTFTNKDGSDDDQEEEKCALLAFFPVCGLVTCLSVL